MMGDVVKLARKRRTRRAPRVPVIRADARDLYDVQEAWKAEDEERCMFLPRPVRHALSDGAASIKAVFDRVLHKHHPEGFPGMGDYDWPEEP
jgi:hypothetical protein